MKKSGFSGVDASVTPYCSVMVSQAVDDTVQTIRDPLHRQGSLPRLDELLILRAERPSLRGARLAKKIEGLVGHLFGNITRITYPEDLETNGAQTPSNTAVLCLTDLDSPVFDGINEQRYGGLQQIVQNAKAALWVVSGAEGDPFVNMSVGWARSVWLENPEMKFQLVDIDDCEATDPKVIATALLRLVCLGIPEAADVLWSTEPEVALRDGALYIPRILPKPKKAVDLTQKAKAAYQGTQNGVDGAHQNGVLGESPSIIIEIAKRHDGALGLQPVPQRLAGGQRGADTGACLLCPSACDMRWAVDISVRRGYSWFQRKGRRSVVRQRLNFVRLRVEHIPLVA